MCPEYAVTYGLRKDTDEMAQKWGRPSASMTFVASGRIAHCTA
jgi:hypothetical protein